MNRVGIDLGGTKIEVAVLGEDGRLVNRNRVATPQGDYERTLDAIEQLVRAAEREFGPFPHLGLGTPGSISRNTGAMKNSNSTCLNGRDLLGDLRARLQCEIRIANDANCFALSEAIDGAGQGASIVFGVILGTGVGGGLVVDGRIIDGPNGITGEWGHNRLASDAGIGVDAPRPCYCGRMGCVETVLSGPALAQAHRIATGLELTPEEIAHGARAGQAQCVQSLERYARSLARALAVVVNIVDPDVIVLGGGVSNIEMLVARVPQLWGEWIFADDVLTRLVHNVHGDSSGVRGAAWL
jgi:predicted NBD/HSP70 family sugar kinase